MSRRSFRLDVTILFVLGVAAILGGFSGRFFLIMQIGEKPYFHLIFLNETTLVTDGSPQTRNLIPLFFPGGE